MKLVSDLKQFLILNDFPSVNEAISLRNQQLRTLQEECDKKLISLRDEIAIDLYELEESITRPGTNRPVIPNVYSHLCLPLLTNTINVMHMCIIRT